MFPELNVALTVVRDIKQDVPAALNKPKVETRR